MKMKVKILVIALMAIFCIAPTSVPKAEAAGTLKTMYVHPSIWSVHGIYTKTSTGKIVYAKNASGFGTVMDKSVLIYQVVGRHIHHQLSYTRTIKTLQ